MAEVKNICLEALERHCSSGHTGRLDLQRGQYQGQIYTNLRLIVHAQLGSLEGIPALFRLLDWGDAETTWQMGLMADRQTLHLSMEAASQLYAENLRDRAELDDRETSSFLQAILAPESVLGQASGLDSVLKQYTVSLECSEAVLLPDGFIFSDSSKSSYVIGSSEECDIVLRDLSVDPLHCGVILEKGSVMIWDLGGQSGVKINGNPVSQDILKVGDVMTLGTLDLRVRFQLKRPTVKSKTVPVPALGAGASGPPGTVPVPQVATTSKEIPKGAITYEKVTRQLRQNNTKAIPFLEKLSSIFGTRKLK